MLSCTVDSRTPSNPVPVTDDTEFLNVPNGSTIDVVGGVLSYVNVEPRRLPNASVFPPKSALSAPDVVT